MSPILCPSKFLSVVGFASISHLIHRRICMSGSHVIATDIALAVSHSYPRRPASRASRKQTVAECCCSAFAENATSGTSKALPRCVDHGYLFLDPFSQASRAKSVVALARSLQLQHSMFSTCTIQLCTGLDSCHTLDEYTHLIQDSSNLAALVSMSGFWALR